MSVPSISGLLAAEVAGRHWPNPRRAANVHGIDRCDAKRANRFRAGDPAPYRSHCPRAADAGRLLATGEVVAGLDNILVRPLGDFWLASKRSSVPVVEFLCPVRGATMAQLSLCARFELAVEAFRGERWAEAESYFQSIHRDYPNDSWPARFYLDQRLPEARRAAAEDDNSPVI